MFIENALCFKCYSIPTPTFARYLSLTRYEWENRKSDNSQFPIILMVVKTFSASCFFLDNGLKSQQETVQFFWNKIKFEGFTIDFKGNKWLFWSRCLELDKRKRPEVWKNRPAREQWKLHVNYLRGQVNFPQLRSETAGNRYLRRFLPASAGNFTCETVYLRPVLQCILKRSQRIKISIKYLKLPVLLRQQHYFYLCRWHIWKYFDFRFSN